MGQATPVLGPDYARGSARVWDLCPEQRVVRDAILRADSPADYEEVSCPCGAVGADILLAEIERHGLPCRNVLCSRCGLVRVSPRWSDGRYQRFYEAEYRDLYDTRSSVPKAEFARAAARAVKARDVGAWCRRTFARLGRQGGDRVTSLEIGAGAGWNSANLPTSWRRIGFDVDRVYLDIGKNLFGVEMEFGLLDEAMERVPDADLVLLSHVVEHFLDPRAVLRRIAGAMKPGALMLIEVPGLLNIHRKHLHLMTYLQNAHTFFFCAETLTAACENSALKVLESDQIARAVCVPSPDQVGSEPPPELAGRILRYLRDCERGWKVLGKLQALPAIGRYSAAVWRRTFYPAVGLRAGNGLASP